MSVSKWRYTEECNGRPCPGDCDHCSFEPADLISRADAIEAFETKITITGINDVYKFGAYIQSVMDKIKALPSAEAVQGEWIFRTDIPIGGGRESAGYVCSNCRKDYFHVDGMNFCPNCGARMKGGADK